MRLFRRKTIIADERERCPRCAERVPVGANHCAMCGVDLRPLLSAARVGHLDKERATS
jgi:hypothetical protein